MSNIKMGKSDALAVTTAAAARALMWQDVAQGRIERPDVATNLETQMNPQLDHAAATLAAEIVESFKVHWPGVHMKVTGLSEVPKPHNSQTVVVTPDSRGQG